MLSTRAVYRRNIAAGWMLRETIPGKAGGGFPEEAMFAMDPGKEPSI